MSFYRVTDDLSERHARRDNRCLCMLYRSDSSLYPRDETTGSQQYKYIDDIDNVTLTNKTATGIIKEIKFVAKLRDLMKISGELINIFTMDDSIDRLLLKSMQR